MLANIDRFGAQAVLGRTLYAREIYRMRVAENIVKAYQSRAESQNWAVWAKEHPALAALLQEAELKDKSNAT